MKQLRVWFWQKTADCKSWDYNNKVFPIKDGKVVITLDQESVLWNLSIQVEVEDYEPS